MLGGLLMNLSTLEMSKIIRNVLDNPEYCPCAFIGQYVPEFKKIYADRILDLHGLEDVRTLIENFSGLKSTQGKFMVLDGIGFLNPTGQNSLLKFIEENSSPIILLAYYDKISPIIMSRIKFVYKQPMSEVKNLHFIGLKEALNSVDNKRKSDPEYSEMDELKFYAEMCPKAFVGKYSCPRHSLGTTRILRMVSKL
jgi:hypothetical protein